MVESRRRNEWLLALALIVAIIVCLLLVAFARLWYPPLAAYRLRHRIETDNVRDLASWALETKSVPTDPSLTIKLEPAIEIASSRERCWFPTVHRFSSGEILVTARMSPDERNPEGEFSAYTVSRDGGRAWSRLYTVGSGANVDASYTQTAGSDLWVLGGGYDAAEPDPAGQRERFRVPLSRISRAGMEFVERRDAVIEITSPAASETFKLFDFEQPDSSEFPRELPLVNPWGDIIEARDGAWLSTAYYKTTNDARSTRLVLIRSANRGLAWKELSVIASVGDGAKPWSWMANEGPSEAGMARLSDGSLYVVFRTAGCLGYARSYDDGATWSQPESLGLRGVAPRLRLLSNGILVCSFGRPGQ